MLNKRAAEAAARRIRRKNRVDAQDVVATVRMEHTARLLEIVTRLINVAIGRVNLRQASVRRTGILDVTALNAIIAAGSSDDDFRNRKGVRRAVGDRRHVMADQFRPRVRTAATAAEETARVHASFHRVEGRVPDATRVTTVLTVVIPARALRVRVARAS